MKKIIEEQTKELRGAGFFDFGRAAYGTLELELEARCGEHVEAVIGECAENGSILHRHGWTTFMLDRFALKPGRRTYRFNIPPHLPAYGGMKHPAVPAECGGEIAPFRYAELNHYYGTATLRRTVWFDDWEDDASDFRSSDPDLDELWAFCKYSIKATNVFGVYVDGERERLPYEADSYIDQLGHFCCDANYKTAKNTIDFFETCPTWPTEWRLLTPVLVRDYFLYSGDRASVDRWLRWLPARLLPETAGEDGLLRNGAKLGIPGLRDIIDWPEHDRDGYELSECNFVPNAYYHGALTAMYELTGDESFRRRAAEVRRTLREKFFREGVPVDSLGSSHTSLHSAVFALRFGIAEETEIPRLAEFVRSRGMACSEALEARVDLPLRKIADKPHARCVRSPFAEHPSATSLLVEPVVFMGAGPVRKRLLALRQLLGSRERMRGATSYRSLERLQVLVVEKMCHGGVSFS